MPALLAPMLDREQFFWRSTVRQKTRTEVDTINHLSYTNLALASRRLRSMHRSSDTIARAAALPGPGFRHPERRSKGSSVGMSENGQLN